MAIIWPYKEGKSVEQELEFYEELLTRVLAEVCLRYLHRAMRGRSCRIGVTRR